MAEEPDERQVVHADPVVQAGFAQIPMAVMTRSDLSAGAKLVYAYLKHLAWQRHGDETMTPMAAVCRDLYVSEPTARGYIKELSTSPRAEGGDPADGTLLTSVRRGLGLSNVYTLHEPCLPEPQNLSDGTKESFVEERREPSDLARPRSLPGKDVKAKKKASPGLRPGGLENGPADPDGPLEPPEVFLVGKRDPCFDAIVQVCEIDPDSPRLGDVGAALHGRPKARHPKPGIRGLFWKELRRYADAQGRLADLAEITPERFSEMLVHQIHRKAETWKTSSDATLTPTALLKYWFEPGAFRRRSGLDPNDVRSIANRVADGG